MIIKSLTDLEAVQKAYLDKQAKYKYGIYVCAGAGCVSTNCGDVRDAIVDELKKNSLTDVAAVYETGCMGTCAVGPVVLVMPEKTFYTSLTPEKAREIVKSHIIEGKILEEYTYFDHASDKHIPCIDDIPFFKPQVKIVLRNCGIMEYNSIDAYIARDGYKAAEKVIGKSSPEEVIAEIDKSGLRGRGGAGVSTAFKWGAALKSKNEDKYIVCNADEGDPGAFMDRSVLEGDPHTVIEGLMIGGYAIGAKHGYVYVRAEYPIAVERLQHAIEEAKACGLLEAPLFGTDFSFDLEIRIGAGAFVCGEETALMASIEGHRGEPRQKPPFPAQRGLFGKPTDINNVETLANVPAIIFNGGEWYAKYGTEKSKGTKVFALAGDILNTGIIEVPIGLPLRDIVYGIGGGMKDGKKFKAAQMGGPSGGCITAENIDVPTDYESLMALGAIMGSGGLIAMNEDTCMVDTARFFMDFIRDESCGKCTACRLGTKRMLEILKNITRGKGKPGDIDLLLELCDVIKDTAMCGLGQTAPNPVLSTIRNFRNEYEEHINDSYCRAGICTSLVKYSIVADKCKGCTACARKCPAGAISGTVKEPHVIDQEKCIKCGACIATCKFGAIVKK